MADFSKSKDYSQIIDQNAVRDEFVCPCCGKSIPVTSSAYEEFELYRERVFSPRIGYNIYKAAYRVCPKCKWKLNATLGIPRRIFIIAIILSILSIIITSIIDFNNIGVYVIGFWLFIATPLNLLVWLLMFVLFWKQNKKIDFDKALNNNAVEWNQHNWKDKGSK